MTALFRFFFCVYLINLSLMLHHLCYLQDVSQAQDCLETGMCYTERAALLLLSSIITKELGAAVTEKEELHGRSKRRKGYKLMFDMSGMSKGDVNLWVEKMLAIKACRTKLHRQSKDLCVSVYEHISNTK